MTSARAAISISNVTKTYVVKKRPHVLALDNISLKVGEGEFLALVGPSGCGKSTLLRMVAGLLPATTGTIDVFGVPISQALPNVGVAFQSPVLMKWRTIFENVRLPLEVQRQRKTKPESRVMDLLELAGIAEFALSYPKELSGGMQQRAAICRALVHDPQLLLLDEPFGALDALTRSRMNVDLARILAAARKTTILITHSIAEAVFLADRVAVMSARPGRIVAIVEVEIPHPRTVAVRSTPRFEKLVHRIGDIIGL